MLKNTQSTKSWLVKISSRSVSNNILGSSDTLFCFINLIFKVQAFKLHLLDFKFTYFYLFPLTREIFLLSVQAIRTLNRRFNKILFSPCFNNIIVSFICRELYTFCRILLSRNQTTLDFNDLILFLFSTRGLIKEFGEYPCFYFRL